MTAPLSRQEALHKAAAYCSSSEQCRHDIREKLQRWKVGDEDILKIIDHLIKERFIDERRYCLGFVNDKFRFNKWGRIKIGYALRQKEIPEDMIIEAIESIDEERYKETLRELLAAKQKSVKASDSYDMQAKLFRFAASRGFESDTIYSVIRSMKLP